ncbi:MAG TPA: replicative DNA helicase [Thermoanaerobaculia bacterium]|nr:replicative DNA helicase [Thermoanaerobaculia bacterium]
MKRKPPSPLFDVPPGVALPHSEESERAVLGAVLLQPELIDKVAARLQVSDFYLEPHRLLFAAMSRLHRAGTPIDLRTLQAELEQRQTFEAAGGLSYLATLDLDLPDIGRLDAYLDIVAERSARRSLIELGGAAVRDSLTGEDDAATLLARLQQEIPFLLQSAVRTRLRPAAEIVPPVMMEIEDRPEALRGIPTGFEGLDRLTAGLCAGNFVLVAGRPGLGKSAFAANVVQNITLRQGLPVGFWTLEMTEQELVLRMICSEADISFPKLRDGMVTTDQWIRVVRAGRALTAAPLWIDETATLTVTQLESRIRRAHADQGIVLAVVDYLQLILPSRRAERREAEVAEISRTLKGLAKSLGIPLVALAQLSREATKRAGWRPTLADLRESGALEADADLVIFVHREHAFNRDAAVNGAELIVAKHRHGETGTVELTWAGATTSFRNRPSHAFPAPAGPEPR